MIEIRIKLYGTPLSDKKECALRKIVKEDIGELSDCEFECYYRENEGLWRDV